LTSWTTHLKINWSITIYLLEDYICAWKVYIRFLGTWKTREKVLGKILRIFQAKKKMEKWDFNHTTGPWLGTRVNRGNIVMFFGWGFFVEFRKNHLVNIYFQLLIIFHFESSKPFNLNFWNFLSFQYIYVVITQFLPSLKNKNKIASKAFCRSNLTDFF
jgi:hypothetical protein